MDAADASKPLTWRELLSFKLQGRKIVMLTAYDYLTAKILDEVGVDVVLVGDSLATTALGLQSTLMVGMPEILHHLRAVVRGLRRCLSVADMPFASYQASVEDACYNACEFLAAGASAVKLEGGGKHQLQVIDRLVEVGVPVIGHIGYTPQSQNALGLGRVQGRAESARNLLIDQAVQLERVGVSMLVLELVPADLAAEIAVRLRIPVIGIGAGPDCDGQVLVIDDMLGRTTNQFKFLRKFADLHNQTIKAVQEYCEEVRNCSYPEAKHSF